MRDISEMASNAALVVNTPRVYRSHRCFRGHPPPRAQVRKSINPAQLVVRLEVWPICSCASRPRAEFSTDFAARRRGRTRSAVLRHEICPIEAQGCLVSLEFSADSRLLRSRHRS